MQTSIPSPYTGMMDGLRKITASEGIGGLYKGLYPLWGRQIPYTMVRINCPHFANRNIPMGGLAVTELLVTRKHNVCPTSPQTKGTGTDFGFPS